MADTKSNPDTVSIKDSVLLDTKPSNTSSVTITQGTAPDDTDPRLKDEMYDSKLEWSEKEENEVRRILDIRLMPFILLMSFVLNMDRTNICMYTLHCIKNSLTNDSFAANAISDNLAEDLGFDNDGVNLSILVYSIIFTLFTLPSNPIAKRIGPHLWIPILMNSWAVVTWAHALIHASNQSLYESLQYRLTCLHI